MQSVFFRKEPVHEIGAESFIDVRRDPRRGSYKQYKEILIIH